MKKNTIIILTAVCLAACSPTTEITGSWKSGDAREAAADINTIMVTALTPRANARQSVENDLSSALEQKGYRTLKSIEVMPPTFTNGERPDKDELLSRIEDSGADAILTVALIDEETETRYVPGNTGYAPMPRYGYYGTFWGYYNNWYPTMHSPGYYEEDKVYFIETNLYDAETEELLWSAQSETYNPKSLPNFADEFADVVVARLEEDNLLNVDASSGLARERR